LDLPTTEKEIYRVLKKGGKAIFLEPVRNSKFIKFIRNLIPYQQKDVSPYERPLTDSEIRDFSKRFSKFESRMFSLPFVNLIKILPINEKWIHRSIKLDGKILKKFGFADNFATICVFTITK
jgi:ubiquinone/menaquinone biosynthesis C-methylase UbiE